MQQLGICEVTTPDIEVVPYHGGMFALVWRALFLWRLWRAFNRSRYAQRFARRAWGLHSQRWVGRSKGSR